MKALSMIGVVLAMLFVFVAGPAEAAVVSNQAVPFEGSVWIFCANDGKGEAVRLSGEMHALFLFTIDENGGRHVASQFQPMGITGYGEVTGDKYQATGVTRHEQYFQPGYAPLEYTLVNNFRVVGQGPGNNFLVHETFHITINANGEVTAALDNFRGECK